MQTALTLVHINTCGAIRTGMIATAANYLPMAHVGSHSVGAVKCQTTWLGRSGTLVNVYTHALCVLVIAHRTLRSGVAPERALRVHTLKAEPTVMGPLHTLIDVFANAIVDLVSRGTCDRSLTDVTPCSIHAALIQLAGPHGQTLIYVLAGASIRCKGESWETGALWPSAH